METHVPCWCDKHRVDPEEATLVLNGVPVCDRECLKEAERDAPRLKKLLDEGVAKSHVTIAVRLCCYSSVHLNGLDRRQW